MHVIDGFGGRGVQVVARVDAVFRVEEICERVAAALDHEHDVGPLRIVVGQVAVFPALAVVLLIEKLDDDAVFLRPFVGELRKRLLVEFVRIGFLEKIVVDAGALDLAIWRAEPEIALQQIGDTQKAPKFIKRADRPMSDGKPAQGRIDASLEHKPRGVDLA